jgi:hypothetical protein
MDLRLRFKWVIVRFDLVKNKKNSKIKIVTNLGKF